VRLWQGAGLRRDEDLALARSTGWLELFSDLVFVVIVTRLAHGLGAHVGRHEVRGFGLAFVGCSGCGTPTPITRNASSVRAWITGC